MSNSYKLVNPYIKGEFETKIKTKSSLDAAKKFYGSLSEHFNNSVPKFYFTIQKGGGKKFYHFEVTEQKKGENVDYSIKPYTIKNNDNAIESYLDSFKAFKGRYNGAKKSSRRSKSKSRSSRKSSRPSSKKMSNRIDVDMEDDFYNDAIVTVPVTSSPISYLYYDPLVYALDSIFIPTFYAYLSPYVELNTRKGSYTYGVVVDSPRSSSK